MWALTTQKSFKINKHKLAINPVKTWQIMAISEHFIAEFGGYKLKAWPNPAKLGTRRLKLASNQLDFQLKNTRIRKA